MAEYQKAIVEKKAKELEPNLTLKSSSKSLLRYLARFKACQELYKADAPACIEQMIKKNYKLVPPARSWIDELKASNAADAADTLVKVLGEPKPAPPKVEKPKVEKPKGGAAKAQPATTPPPAPPQAAQNLNDLLKPPPPKSA